MPPRDWKFRIKDILDAIRTVQGYTLGLEYESFVADRKTVDAVVRNLIVTGEAAVHVPDDVVMAHPEIPWKDMSDMRNFVVYEYFGISNKVIWGTVQNDLPPLIPLLKSRLNSETGNAGRP